MCVLICSVCQFLQGKYSYRVTKRGSQEETHIISFRGILHPSEVDQTTWASLQALEQGGEGLRGSGRSNESCPGLVLLPALQLRDQVKGSATWS